MTSEGRPTAVPSARLPGGPGSTEIDEASDDSFPASDPPSWSLSATISRTRNRVRLEANRPGTEDRDGNGAGPVRPRNHG
jgi:hypothetical protein